MNNDINNNKIFQQNVDPSDINVESQFVKDINEEVSAIIDEAENIVNECCELELPKPEDVSSTPTIGTPTKEILNYAIAMTIANEIPTESIQKDSGYIPNVDDTLSDIKQATISPEDIDEICEKYDLDKEKLEESIKQIKEGGGELIKKIKEQSSSYINLQFFNQKA